MSGEQEQIIGRELEPFAALSSDKENLNTSSQANNGNINSQPTSQASSLSNSISLIKLDEISSFGATKQARLPALISIDKSKMSNSNSLTDNGRQVRSMPVYSAEQLEQATPTDQAKNSLPANAIGQTNNNDENKVKEGGNGEQDHDSESISGGFHMVDMDSDGLLIGPSLPAIPTTGAKLASPPKSATTQPLASQPAINNQQHQPNSVQLGDSLIDMVIDLRNENQNLLQALQKNNDYVRERLDEFKQVGEQAKLREEQYAKEKADLEHDNRKLKRQNSVLSERLKSMEAKLKDMKIEVSDSLAAAHSSRASSNQADFDSNLYPHLEAPPASTLQMMMDVGNEELNDSSDDCDEQNNAHANMDTSEPNAPNGAGQSNGNHVAFDVSRMSKEELSKHFDADKVAFYSMDDRMKQCDHLEQQLNDIGNRDYEIYLLQQQLNIYRQDFRLERMANLEAKIQIEKLKNEIDELCLKRLQEKHRQAQQTSPKETFASSYKGSTERFMGRVGRKAARSAAKAAKYAAKHAHLEEKAAAAASALAARYSQATAANAGNQQHASPMDSRNQQHGEGSSHAPAGPQHVHQHGHHHRRSHHHRHSGSSSSPHHKQAGIKSEVVNDLWETANKAMMTGYKMASTHVNLALDKLTEFEQSQATYLAKNKQQNQNQAPSSSNGKPSAPPSRDYPSID